MIGVFCDGSRAALRRLTCPEPEPGPGEVALRVLAAGICATDLQLARGYMGFRGVLGHEFVGLGDDGRRYTAEINNACHVCDDLPTRACPGHCPNRTVLGILGHDGAMAEWVCVPATEPACDPRHSRRRRRGVCRASGCRVPHRRAGRPRSGYVRMAIVGDGKLGLLCAWASRLCRARAISLVGKHSLRSSPWPGTGSQPTSSTRHLEACPLL